MKTVLGLPLAKVFLEIERIILFWHETLVSYTSYLIKLCAWLATNRSVVCTLKQVGFKINCSNLLISQKSLNFLFSGIILKSRIIIVFSYVVQKIYALFKWNRKSFLLKNGGLYNSIENICTLLKIISKVRISKIPGSYLLLMILSIFSGL